jgi:hypothetical protein
LESCIFISLRIFDIFYKTQNHEEETVVGATHIELNSSKSAQTMAATPPIGSRAA